MHEALKLEFSHAKRGFTEFEWGIIIIIMLELRNIGI